jgi:hypothetical protein
VRERECGDTGRDARPRPAFWEEFSFLFDGSTEYEPAPGSDRVGEGGRVPAEYRGFAVSGTRGTSRENCILRAMGRVARGHVVLITASGLQGE